MKTQLLKLKLCKGYSENGNNTYILKAVHPFLERWYNLQQLLHPSFAIQWDRYYDLSWHNNDLKCDSCPEKLFHVQVSWYNPIHWVATNENLKMIDNFYKWLRELQTDFHWIVTCVGSIFFLKNPLLNWQLVVSRMSTTP